MTLQRQLNRPCAFFSHLFKNHIERFHVAMQHSLWQTGNYRRNGSETARFTPGHFFEMAIIFLFRYFRIIEGQNFKRLWI